MYFETICLSLNISPTKISTCTKSSYIDRFVTAPSHYNALYTLFNAIKHYKIYRGIYKTDIKYFNVCCQKLYQDTTQK